MSIFNLILNTNRLRKDIAALEKQLSDEKKKEATILSKINQINRSITNYTSVSSLKTKEQQLVRLQNDIAKNQAKQADISKKIASKSSDLSRYELQLSKEQERERKKIEDAQKRREREQLQHQRKLTKELEEQKRLIQEITTVSAVVNIDSADEMNEAFDLFISHASEDKEEFVRPLAEELERIGVKVWYDEFTLKVGDSLRKSIDKGLARSRFGVVVLSSSFFKKNWTEYELNGMVAREMEGQKVILPIWHKVTKSEVMNYSPTLADKVALNSSLLSVEEIAKELANVI